MNKLQIFFALSVFDKLLFIRVFLVVLMFRLSIKLVSFQRLKSTYNSLLTTAETKNFSPAEIQQKVRFIKSAANFLGATCVPQALTLKYFLRKDKSAEIRVGVSQKEGFAAHAWVEKNNEILIGETPNKDFMPIWNWQ